MNYTSSKTPLEDIEKVAYEGQPMNRRMYREGYAGILDNMPKLTSREPFFEQRERMATDIMDKVAELVAADPWSVQDVPMEGGFNRTIIDIEPPVDGQEGAEVVVAKWGKGMTTPAHGHADGYLYEGLVHGRMALMRYRMVDPLARIARPWRMDVLEPGVFASRFLESPANGPKRANLLHAFKALTPSVTVHFLPEHVRDARDNRVEVQHFGGWYGLRPDDAQRLTPSQAMASLRVGDVALVRSRNVEDYGDHYIVITGPVVSKPHGNRHEEVAIEAPDMAEVLDEMPDQRFILLKLKPEAQNAFLQFHGISVGDGMVQFPLA